jgi:hypothetical protein
VEAEEVGALDDGWSGSSHGRLWSSRRTAFPQTASDSCSPSSPSPPFSFSGGGVDRGGFSPEAARVGRTQGSAARLLIAVGALGHVVGYDAAAACGGTPRQRHGGLPGALAR